MGTEQAAAPHPRPAKAPASALSPEGAGERVNLPTAVILGLSPRTHGAASD